jgi:hypothetical protein
LNLPAPGPDRADARTVAAGASGWPASERVVRPSSRERFGGEAIDPPDASTRGDHGRATRRSRLRPRRPRAGIRDRARRRDSTATSRSGRPAKRRLSTGAVIEATAALDATRPRRPASTSSSADIRRVARPVSFEP